jgi:signal transduction histidine kinase
VRRASRDVVLATCLTAACEAELFTHLPASPRTLLAAVFLVGAGVAVAVRRRAPLAAGVLALCLGLLAAASMPGADELVSPQYVLFVPPYSIGAHASRRRVYVGLCACVAAIAAFSASRAQTLGSWAFALAAIGGSVFVGRLTSRERELDGKLTAAALALAAGRERAGRLAVQEVRTQISEDVTALVAYSVTSMIVATEAALRLLDDHPDEADAAMAGVESAGREALSEMRRVLGVLRHGEPAT